MDKMKCEEYITDRIFRNKKGYFSKPKKNYLLIIQMYN